jgi:hypothetical protein
MAARNLGKIEEQGSIPSRGSWMYGLTVGTALNKAQIRVQVPVHPLRRSSKLSSLFVHASGMLEWEYINTFLIRKKSRGNVRAPQPRPLIRNGSEPLLHGGSGGPIPSWATI